MYNITRMQLSNFAPNLQVDYIAYSDELATEVDCKPNLYKLLFSDPALALRCFFGPCIPAQYRLMGPGAWEGAKKAIEDAPGNVIYTIKTRVCPQADKLKGIITASSLSKLLILVVVIAAIFMRFLHKI